jgi:hypothetical protein
MTAYTTNMARNASIICQPARLVSQSGTATASAPRAAKIDPKKLYRAKTLVRTAVAAAPASTVCSSGRNTLTSPPLGFSGPRKATTSSGHSDVSVAKPRPVAAIITAAASSRRRSAKRCPQRPTASVAIAEPRSVAVLRSPTSSWPWPSASR